MCHLDPSLSLIVFNCKKSEDELLMVHTVEDDKEELIMCGSN